MSTPEEQLALVHIGIMVKDFVTKDHLPENLDYVAQKLCEHLNIYIGNDDDILTIRDKVVNAYVDNLSQPLIINDLDAFDRAMRGI